MTVFAVLLLPVFGPHRGDALGSVPPRSYRVLLTWDAIPDPGVIGHRVHYGTVSGEYTDILEVGSEPTATVTELTGGVTYYFVVTAFDASGQESEHSDEISFTPGPRHAPKGLTIRIGAGTPVGVGGVAREAVVTMDGVEGEKYVIEASDDLNSWFTLSTITVDSAGCAEFTDRLGALHPTRYYRARRSD